MSVHGKWMMLNVGPAESEEDAELAVQEWMDKHLDNEWMVMSCRAWNEGMYLISCKDIS